MKMKSKAEVVLGFYERSDIQRLVLLSDHGNTSNHNAYFLSILVLLTLESVFLGAFRKRNKRVRTNRNAYISPKNFAIPTILVVFLSLKNMLYIYSVLMSSKSWCFHYLLFNY